MKRFFLTIASIGFFATLAQAAVSNKRDAGLIRKADRVAESLRDSIYDLTNHEKEEIRYNLNNVSQILRGVGSTDPSQSYYCVAACKKTNGKPNISYSASGSAEYRSEAEQQAIEAVKNKFNCNYGVAIHMCDSPKHYTIYVCSAACSNSNGKPTIQYSETGKGSTQLEASYQAREKVRQDYNCNYGIVDNECSEDNDPHYCTAACTRSNGTPNMTYSKGSRGTSLVGAKTSAVESVRKSYSCKYGISVDSCERRN